jgi:hypothetical protein
MSILEPPPDSESRNDCRERCDQIARSPLRWSPVPCCPVAGQVCDLLCLSRSSMPSSPLLKKRHHSLGHLPPRRPISVSGVVRIGPFASSRGQQILPRQSMFVWVGGCAQRGDLFGQKGEILARCRHLHHFWTQISEKKAIND